MEKELERKLKIIKERNEEGKKYTLLRTYGDLYKSKLDLEQTLTFFETEFGENDIAIQGIKKQIADTLDKMKEIEKKLVNLGLIIETNKPGEIIMENELPKVRKIEPIVYNDSDEEHTEKER